MKYTSLVLPQIDFRSGFVACTGISHNGHPGEPHSKIIKEFEEFEKNPDGTSELVITENTLRNWLYRKNSEEFIPRWDIVFKLCRWSGRNLSDILGIRRNAEDLCKLIGLEQTTVDVLEKYTKWDFYHPELEYILPRHGLLVDYVLRSAFFGKVVVPYMMEYESQLVHLSAIPRKIGDYIDTAIPVTSELYKKRLIRNFRPHVLDFVNSFASEIQYGTELTMGDTRPISIPDYEVDPKEAFRIGLNLAVYHKQNPGDIRYSADAILDKNNDQTLPTVNVHKFHSELNEFVKERFPELISGDETSREKEFVVYSSVYGWISGQFIPKALCLRVLCAYFSCDIDYLFGGQRFPMREYDKIADRTGFSNITCKWIHALSEKAHEYTDYWVANEFFHFVISHMQYCVIFYTPIVFNEFGGGLIMEQALQYLSDMYDQRLDGIAAEYLNFPDEMIFNPSNNDTFVDFLDKETFLTEYLLNDLTEYFVECFSDILNSMEKAYLDIEETSP